MDLSIVIPVWNEEGNIIPLYKEIKKSVKSIPKHEIIFIDDGSDDKTFKEIQNLEKKDKKVNYIKLRKHVGKSQALSAGFNAAKGKHVITMDGDLQDDPKEIPRFIKTLKQENLDVVVGWKYDRQDPITKKWPSKIFNKLTAKMTDVNIHDSNCCFKVFKNEVVKDINIYGELHRYIPALAHWKGYRVGEMKVNHRARKHGSSKYGIMRLLIGFLDLLSVKFIVSYSKKPMHLFGSLGVLSLVAGFLINLYLLYIKLAFNIIIGDRPLLLLGILLMVIGIQFISLGLLGELIVVNRKNI